MSGFSLGIGDLITVACLTLDCSLTSGDHVALVPTQHYRAPIEVSSGRQYFGTGHSDQSPELARQAAFADILTQITFETGFELSTIHRYSITAGNQAESSSAQLNDTRSTLNFLQGGQLVQYESETIDGGYQASVAYLMDQSDLTAMRQWSRSVRDLRYDLIANPYIHATGYAERSENQTLREAKRIAKLRAIEELAEHVGQTLQSSAVVTGDRLIDDTLKTRTYAFIKGVETLEVDVDTQMVRVTVRMLNPATRLLIGMD